MMRRFFLPFSVKSYLHIAVVPASYNTNTTTRLPYHTTAAALAKIIEFNLSDIGEGILEVDVLQVFVKPGDIVKAFDKICEVQSDKATVEITSRYDGRVEYVHIAKGRKAYTGKPIIDIEVDDSIAGKNIMKPKEVTENNAQTSPAQASPAQASAAAVDASNESAIASGKVLLAIPSVRRLAKENNVDLTKVVPSGKGNRIMKEDVLAFIEKGICVTNTSAASGITNDTTIAAPPAARSVAASAESLIPTDHILDYTIPITGIRKAMMRTMTEANKIPAFGASDEIDITNLIAARELLKPVFKQRSNGRISLSYLPFFIKAASLALLQYPELNAITNSDCTELLVKGAHNIGFAMDTASGLIVPNIKNVENKSLYHLADDILFILEKGKLGKVSRENMEGGTFTLSNIGSIGATYAVPVIFPPQVVIGAIGKLMKVPRFDTKGQVVAANIINVSWSADHRVVDGATMVRFNNLFKSYLENPVAMLVDLK